MLVSPVSMHPKVMNQGVFPPGAGVGRWSDPQDVGWLLWMSERVPLDNGA